MNVRSPLSGWLGGKFQLARRIVPLIPRHVCYCEPFFGAGWVLCKKPPSPIEVANDASGELINCWRVIRDKPEELQRLCDWSLVSRLEFEELACMSPREVAAMGDVERAWRLLYILKNCYCGRDVGNVAQGYAGKKKPTFPPKKRSEAFYGGKTLGHKEQWIYFLETLASFRDRVKHTRFEHGDFARVIRDHDRETTFFYLDPPYIGCGDFYGGDFSMADQERLADILAKVAGKFILSLNDCQEARALYRGFQIYRASVKYSIGMNNNKQTTELLISNYDFDPEACRRYNVERADENHHPL